ncbi:ORF037 [Saltwater crocodilepox virus]|nr:ORF037 [Saltwater crocodilepox virus]
MWKVALTIVWVLLSNQTAAIKESITQRECDDDPWYCTNNYQPRHNWFDEFVNWFLVFFDPIWSVDVLIGEELENLASASSLIVKLEKQLAEGLQHNGYSAAGAGPRANQLMKEAMTT